MFKRTEHKQKDPSFRLPNATNKSGSYLGSKCATSTAHFSLAFGVTLEPMFIH